MFRGYSSLFNSVMKRGYIVAVLFVSLVGGDALTTDNVKDIKTDLRTLYADTGKYMGRALRLSK